MPWHIEIRAKGAKACMKPLLVSSICTNCFTAQLKVQGARLVTTLLLPAQSNHHRGGGNTWPAKYHARWPDALEGKL
jgi:hypothetical protein